MELVTSLKRRSLSCRSNEFSKLKTTQINSHSVLSVLLFFTKNCRANWSFWMSENQKRLAIFCNALRVDFMNFKQACSKVYFLKQKILTGVVCLKDEEHLHGR